MAIDALRRLFTVADYYRMAEAGVFAPDERVELIEGEVIRVNPIGPPHANDVRRLSRVFFSRLGDRVEVSVQLPVRLHDLSEPEPDIALLAIDRDQSVHPGPRDVLLLVEVSHSSLGFDRRVKLPMYARAGIPEVWIVDVSARALEVYRDPGPEGYASLGRLFVGDEVSPLAFPDISFSVAELLGSIP